MNRIEELFEGYDGNGSSEKYDWGRPVGREIITDDEETKEEPIQ